jgi:hypothetical protein
VDQVLPLDGFSVWPVQPAPARGTCADCTTVAGAQVALPAEKVWPTGVWATCIEWLVV